MWLVKMPRLGQDMEQGTLVEWIRSVGEPVEEGGLLAVIETEKAEVVFESPYSGYLVEILVEPGITVPAGTPLGWIADDSAARPPPPEPSSEQRAVTSGQREPSGGSGRPRRQTRRAPSRKPVSPVARRRARELGVDPAGVEGTGPGGRVTEADVLKAHEAARATSPEQGGLSRMRMAIAERMTRSAAIPQFHLMREIVLEKPEDQGEGTKVTYTDLVLWATARALADRPAVNSSWIDGSPPSVRSHPGVDLGFAVALEDGLIVPVIKDAASLSPQQISIQRRRLEGVARRGRLGPEDVGGGTFTVSNLGTAAVDRFTALINPPEAGILAMGAVKPRPVVLDGTVVAAPTVCLTLTGDHRVFDGMEGAKFLAAIDARLQSLAQS